MLDIGEFRNLTRRLNQGDDSSRRQALQTLKHLDKQQWDAAPASAIHAAVDALEQLLGEKNAPFFRQEAAAVLGNLGPRGDAAVPQLMGLLHEGLHYRIRETAAVALGKIGSKAKPAVDKLIEMLPGSRPDVAVHVVRALSDIGCADQRVRTALVGLWHTPPSANVQIQAAIALCKLRVDAPGLLTYLGKVLVANHDVVPRKAAAEALAARSKNDIDVVPALVAALHDKNDEVKQAAEAGLAQLRLSQDKAIRLCAKQLKDSSFAEPALRNSGQPAVGPLIEALGSAEPPVREAAARILGGLGELAVAAVPQLTKALHDKNADVRLAAAKGLWSITKQPDPIVPALVDLLKQKWPAAQDAGESQRRFQQTVIEALRRIGPPAKAAIPALTVKSRDKNRYVSESALGAINEIAPGTNGAKPR